MQLRLLFLLLVFTQPSYGLLTFDAQNYAQGVKNFTNQLKQINELKQQTQHFAAQTKLMVEQAVAQKENIKGLSKNNILDMYKQMDGIDAALSNSKKTIGKFEELDSRYRKIFGASKAEPLPSQQENFDMRAHLERSMETNKRARDSLKVLESYEKDKKRLKDVESQSFQAGGHMQAIQSTNQLAALQVKELQELKILMSQNLETRLAAVSEENAARVVAYQRHQEEMAKPIKLTKAIKLPNLKGGKY